MAATSITRPWADGTYTFHLDIPMLEELQKRTASSPFEILGRLGGGAARIADLKETIRLGLIGGGTKPADAEALIRTYVDPRPLVEALELALWVLGAAVMGSREAEAVGKPMPAKTAPATRTPRARKGRSTSPASAPRPS